MSERRDQPPARPDDHTEKSEFRKGLDSMNVAPPAPVQSLDGGAGGDEKAPAQSVNSDGLPPDYDG